MSKAIPADSLPLAVLGVELSVSPQELKDLRSKGVLVATVDQRLGAQMVASLLDKHRNDVQIVPVNASLIHGGRYYRLEIVTMTRDQWVAHHNEWAQIEAERDMYKAELEKYKANSFPPAGTAVMD